MKTTQCRHTVSSLVCIWFWNVYIKQSHYMSGQALRFQGIQAPRFQDNQHMKVVKLSALHTGRLQPQKILLVLISVRG